METINKAIYAGTFDPFTLGHYDILKRALKVFDEVTVLVAVSPTKSPMFSREHRIAMLEELFKDDKRVKVEFWDGLVVDYAKKSKVNAILRGLRPAGDFDVEFQMAAMNNKLYPEVETVCLMTRGEHYFICSTSVREVFDRGGDISQFVPLAIYEYLNKKI